MKFKTQIKIEKYINKYIMPEILKDLKIKEKK